jgi:putative membrane protein
VLLSLGLFVFVLNALMLWLTATISMSLGLEFQIDNFFAALLGALIVGIVSTALNILVGPRKP